MCLTLKFIIAVGTEVALGKDSPDGEDSHLS